MAFKIKLSNLRSKVNLICIWNVSGMKTSIFFGIDRYLFSKTAFYGESYRKLLGIVNKYSPALIWYLIWPSMPNSYCDIATETRSCYRKISFWDLVTMEKSPLKFRKFEAALVFLCKFVFRWGIEFLRYPPNWIMHFAGFHGNWNSCIDSFTDLTHYLLTVHWETMHMISILHLCWNYVFWE